MGPLPTSPCGVPEPFPRCCGPFPGLVPLTSPSASPILYPEFSGHSSLLSLRIPLPQSPAVPYPQALAVCVLPFFLAFFFFFFLVASWTSTHNSFRLSAPRYFTQRPLASWILSLWPPLKSLLHNLKGMKRATSRARGFDLGPTPPTPFPLCFLLPALSFSALTKSFSSSRCWSLP